MGIIVDNVVIDKVKLTNAHREGREAGAGRVRSRFNGNNVTGTVAMNGTSKPVNIDLGGPDFADGAGSMDVIGALPLADGYKTTFHVVDLQKMEPKIMELSVTGSETVTVNAVSFDAYKVELKPADGSADRITVWISKDKHEPVKYSAVLASMGGATVTAERRHEVRRRIEAGEFRLA